MRCFFLEHRLKYKREHVPSSGATMGHLEGAVYLTKGEKEVIPTQHEFASFGVLLQTFRIRKHLTQQHLADALGMHRHTISRWEQGDFLPGSKSMVLELARRLHLDEQETRQLLEASLTALSPYWSVS